MIQRDPFLSHTKKIQWYWFASALCFFIGLLLFSSCSNTKYLAVGEELYVKGRISLDPASKKTLSKEVIASLQSVMVPEPNKKFLGGRLKLAIHNRVKEPKKETGFKHFLKYKLGEPPVLMSDVDPNRTALLMQNRLNTYGHFRSHVRDTVTRKKQRVTVDYYVRAATPYIIDSVFFPAVTDRMTKKIMETKDSSLLVKGGQYNLQTISNERDRIDRMLKIEGYFFFNPDFIIVRVDTNIRDHRCNMYVDLKRNIPPEALKFFYIGDIYVFPEYSLSQRAKGKKVMDTLMIDSIYYVSSQHLFRPAAILESVHFRKGEIYDARDYRITIGRLMGLGVFKYGNIKFERDSLHDSWLTTKIYLTPFPKRSARAELQGIVKDNGFAGPGLTLSTRNRNIFRGAELFVLNFTGNYELQISRNLPPLQAFKFGINPQLIFPKFLVPFHMKKSVSVFVPKTVIETKPAILRIGILKY